MNGILVPDSAARRKKLLRQTTAEVKEVLANLNGLRRLRAITDEQWNEALKADNVETSPDEVARAA